jgi:large subunit ribosomal protein L19e
MSLQKKLAAKILKVGESHVWIDPSRAKDMKSAITRIDIKKLIKQHAIKALPEKIKRPAKKRRKGAGSRKGSKYAVVPRKKQWMATVRSLRQMLKDLRASKQIDNANYKKLYMLVKGGMFRSRSHLRIYLEQHGILKK